MVVRFKLSIGTRACTAIQLPKLVVCLYFCILVSGTSAGFAAEAEVRFTLPSTDEGLPGDGPIRRYEWFQDLWQSRRSGWAETIQQDQGAVVFLGDSIIQGWGEGLPAAFPGMKVVNRGISGDTTRGVLIRLEQDVLAVNPVAVVLLIGTNDLEEAAEPAVIASNVRLILDALSNFERDMPIVFCDIMPSSSRMRRPTEQIQSVNALYLEMLDDYSQVVRLDTFSLFDNGHGDADPSEFPDLLHPNEVAYDKWAEALRSHFRQIGLLD